MSLHEKASFMQCLKVLYRHEIALVTFEGLDCREYYSIADSLNVKVKKCLFDESFFCSINGYNKLCKSLAFYKKFSKYDYMLIYQLDSWVFNDDLIYWCNKKYDYVGAPWFKNYGSHENGDKLWNVGNGGFSLRKISWFIKVLSWKGPIMRRIILKHFSILDILFFFVWHNTWRTYSLSGRNEDQFFSLDMRNSWIPPTIPKCEEAALFSFEKSPHYLFKITGQLPFGCHAYLKYDYDGFWSQYIPSS